MAKHKSEEYRTNIIQRYLESGSGAGKFAREADVTLATFYAWLRKYRQANGIPVAINKTKQIIQRSDIPEIIEMMESGDYTLQAIGNKYGVSRERIRQILVRETGRGGGNQLEKRRRIRKRKLKEYLAAHKYYCEGCGVSVTNGEAKTGNKFCKKCRQLIYDGIDPRITLVCLWCGSDYHPRRAYRYLEYDPKTCSISCGIKYRKRNKRMGAYDRNRKKD